MESSEYNLNFPLSRKSGQKDSGGGEEVKRGRESRKRRERKTFRGNGERMSGRGVEGKLGVECEVDMK